MLSTRFISLIVFAAVGVAVTASLGCGNAGEARRRDFRETWGVWTSSGEGGALSRAERVAVNAAVLAGTRPESSSPTMRWQAAKHLGDFGDPAAYDLLVEKSMSVIADPVAEVRRECVIALGKLSYAGPDDERRKALARRLERRLAFDRDEGPFPRFIERNGLVRKAMLDTLITLGLSPERAIPNAVIGARVSSVPGYRDVAGALQTIAATLYGDPLLRDGRENDFLVESALRGLEVVTGVDGELAASKRATLTRRQFIGWWLTDVISAMPRME